MCEAKGTCLGYHVVCSVRDNTENLFVENISLRSTVEILQDENTALQSRIKILESNLNEKEEAIKNLNPSAIKATELEAECIRLQTQIAGFSSDFVASIVFANRVGLALQFLFE